MRFVKINCDIQGQYPEWFIELTSPRLSLEKQLEFHTSMVGYEMTRLLHREPADNKELEEIQSRNATERLKILIGNHIDYNALVEKYGTIYVRQIGSYMTLGKNQTIIGVCESDAWPTNEAGAEIVICENDLVAEKHWLEYLTREYKNKQVNVLNGFRNRPIEDVVGHFESAKLITFSTTFSNPDWFELMLTALDGMNGKTIVGHCFDAAKIREIRCVYADEIAKIEQLGNKFKWVESLY